MYEILRELQLKHKLANRHCKNNAFILLKSCFGTVAIVDRRVVLATIEIPSAAFQSIKQPFQR